MGNYNVDWKMKLIFWFMRRTPPPTELNYLQVRAGSNTKLLGLLFRRFPVASIENRSIPSRKGNLPVRIYRPKKPGNLPVIVFFHGGGFVLCGLESHDAICRRIASENEALVVAVDYRLAPEYKFPAAVEDAYDATLWVANHAAELGGKPDQLIVMGDSAGGNLAAVVSLMARDMDGPPIACQVLIYPVVDMAGTYPSKQGYADNPVINYQAMDFYSKSYISQPDDIKNPQVSPLLVKDFHNLPPALILTAEYDPLRDEGKAYANRLGEAGNEVIFNCFAGMPHGFLSFGRLASGTEPAFSQIKQALLRFSTDTR